MIKTIVELIFAGGFTFWVSSYYQLNYKIPTSFFILLFVFIITYLLVSFIVEKILP